MRDHKRRRMAGDPFENGRAHVVEVLLGAGAMLGVLLWYLMS
jgi:hypothetical protein